MPIHDNKDHPWDSSAAMKRVKAWAGAEDAPNAKFRKAFLYYDSENADKFSSYKLPIGDIFDGKMEAVYKACVSAKGALDGMKGGMMMPEGDMNACMTKVEKYLAMWDEGSKQADDVTAKHFDGEKVQLTMESSVVAVPSFEDATVEVKKAFESAIERGAKVEKGLGYGEVTVLVSNSGTDRYGESIDAKGIDLSQIKRNPVVLWAHDYSSLPIGQITKIWKQGDNTMANIKLDYDLYDFADTVYKMMLRGTINAVSIGGIVKQWNESYTVIEKMEMVELSVVPVGAHPDALVVAKSMGIEEADIRKQFDAFVKKVLLDKFSKVGKDELNTHIKSLETVLETLKSSQETKGIKETKETKRVKLYVLKRQAGEAAYHVGQINKLVKIKLRKGI